MKPIPNTIYRGKRYYYRYWTGGAYALPNPISTVSAGPDRRERLTCSSIIKGNKTDPNPFSYTKVEIAYPRGKTTLAIEELTGPYKGRTSWESWEGLLSFYEDEDPFMIGVSYPSYLYNSTLSQLNEKVRGTLDLSVSLAEAGQTARMFRVTEGIRSFVHEFRGWRGVIRGVAKARLQFAYGWKPLANDLYQAANESLRLVLNEIESVKARCSEGISHGSGDFTLWGAQGVNTRVIRNGQYRCELGLKFKTKGHNVDRWASLNPVSIAWELMPYSFVIDWMVNVGGYLRDLETSLLYNNSFVNGYHTQVIAFDATWHSVRKTVTVTSTTRETSTVDATATYRYRYLTRTLLTSYPAPRPPSFKADLGTGRLLNLAALIGSKLKVR